MYVCMVVCVCMYVCRSVCMYVGTEVGTYRGSSPEVGDGGEHWQVAHQAQEGDGPDGDVVDDVVRDRDLAQDL